jgi:hypothetical protein
MATRNIAITYPDGAAAKIIAALKWHYGQVDDGNGGLRDMTNAEAFAKFEQGVRQALKDIVRRYDEDQAVTAAKATVTETPVT